MSFGALPTELDQCILRLLDKAELHNISKVSKYLRGIAEPMLYRDLSLKTGQDTKVRLLLLTLIARSDLARRTMTVGLSGTQPSDYRLRHRRSTAFSRIRNSFDALHTAISEAVMAKYASDEICVSWLGAILSDECMEGSLALIIYLATNIRSVTIETPDTCYGSCLGKFLASLNNGDPAAPQRLSQLQDVKLRASTTVVVPIFQSMRSLAIDSGAYDLAFEYQKTTSAHLHTFTLINVRVWVPEVVKILTCGYAANLVRL
jgi:hypothetical protein